MCPQPRQRTRRPFSFCCVPRRSRRGARGGARSTCSRAQSIRAASAAVAEPRGLCYLKSITILLVNRTGLAGRWRREPCEAAQAAAEAVNEALQVPPLQRLALARVTEMEIRETDDALEASKALAWLPERLFVYLCGLVYFQRYCNFA